MGATRFSFIKDTLDFFELRLRNDGRYRGFIAYFVERFNEYAFFLAFAIFTVINVYATIFFIAKQGV